MLENTFFECWIFETSKMSKIKPLEILLQECYNFEKDIIENKKWTKKNILLLLSLLKNMIECQIEFETTLEELKNQPNQDKDDSNLLSIPLDGTESEYEQSQDSEDLEGFVVKDNHIKRKKPKNFQKPL